MDLHKQLLRDYRGLHLQGTEQMLHFKNLSRHSLQSEAYTTVKTLISNVQPHAAPSRRHSILQTRFWQEMILKSNLSAVYCHERQPPDV